MLNSFIVLLTSLAFVPLTVLGHRLRYFGEQYRNEHQESKPYSRYRTIARSAIFGPISKQNWCEIPSVASMSRSRSAWAYTLGTFGVRH